MKKIISYIFVIFFVSAAINIDPVQALDNRVEEEGFISSINYKRKIFKVNGRKFKAYDFTEIEVEDSLHLEFCQLRKGQKVEVEGWPGKKFITATEIKVKDYKWTECLPTPVTLKGHISDIDTDAGAIAVKNKIIEISEGTNFKGDVSSIYDLCLDHYVKVKGVLLDKSHILAKRIKAWNDKEKVIVKGEISEKHLAASTIEVKGKIILITNKTKFKGMASNIDDLYGGQIVKVRGASEPCDTVIEAILIKAK